MPERECAMFGGFLVRHTEKCPIFGNYEVLGWEKVQTPKGEFEAFKLSRNYEVTTRSGDRLKTSETYYYSPKAKAIILLKIKSPRNELTITLIDYNVSN